MTLEEQTALFMILDTIDNKIANIDRNRYQYMNGVEQDADAIIKALELLREHIELGAKDEE
jgi:hypothetical protein